MSSRFKGIILVKMKNEKNLDEAENFNLNLNRYSRLSRREKELLGDISFKSSYLHEIIHVSTEIAFFIKEMDTIGHIVDILHRSFYAPTYNF